MPRKLEEKKQRLTTIVQLRYSTEPDSSNDRYHQELIDLATSTAEFAHKDAECTFPFKVWLNAGPKGEAGHFECPDRERPQGT
ncbi:hypothetical protein [Streptomyces sp. NPDC058463]|uniref:hypothetical protein n=1 Tax=Streptomyces sp. NPDC058463 TaxID=3346510 RepID=UPI00365EBE21